MGRHLKVIVMVLMIMFLMMILVVLLLILMMSLIKCLKLLPVLIFLRFLAELQYLLIGSTFFLLVPGLPHLVVNLFVMISAHQAIDGMLVTGMGLQLLLGVRGKFSGQMSGLFGTLSLHH